MHITTMKHSLITLLVLLLSPLAFAQCEGGTATLLCYDYPGAITQNLNIEDIRTIAWYLRWYSHTEGNPRFWTMYNSRNETTTSASLNSTLPIPLPLNTNATTGINGSIPFNVSTTIPVGPTGTGFVGPTGTGVVVGNGTTATFNSTAPFGFNNGTVPSGTVGTATALAGPTGTGVVVTTNETFIAPNADSTHPISTPQTPAADTCMEWTVITRGTVMLLARLGSDGNASVLYDDIAYSLDGISGDWGKWVPRASDDATPVLVDCQNAGGQVPVYVNASNAEYQSEEFKRRGYATEGIVLKLVHTAAGGEMDGEVGGGVLRI